jgi:hypothetical protein
VTAGIRFADHGSMKKPVRQPPGLFPFACDDQRGAAFGAPGGGLIRVLPEGFATLFLPAEILPASLPTSPMLPVVVLPARPVVEPFMDEPLALPLADEPPAAELPPAELPPAP